MKVVIDTQRSELVIEGDPETNFLSYDFYRKTGPGAQKIPEVKITHALLDTTAHNSLSGQADREPLARTVKLDASCAENYEGCELPGVFSGLRPGGTYLWKIGVQIGLNAWVDEFLVTLPIPPSPFPSWSFKEEAGVWVPPISHPDSRGCFFWDEASLSWIEGDFLPRAHERSDYAQSGRGQIQQTLVDESTASARFRKCLACPFFVKETHQCSQCLCYMRYKVHQLSAECPCGLWQV